jgi:hypothetical protein
MDALKPKKEAAERAAARNVPTIIGHIGDFDKAGKDIGNVFTEDALAFADWHRDFDNGRGSLTIQRLALTEQQAREHELLDRDGKAEVDGLPVPVLDEIVRAFIESHLDPNIAWKVVKAEPTMRATASRLISRKIKKAVVSGKPDKRGADWSWAH